MQTRVGIAKAVSPRDPQNPRGVRQFAGARGGEVRDTGVGEAGGPIGSDDEHHAVTFIDGSGHGPGGEQCLIVGMRMDEHQGARHDDHCGVRSSSVRIAHVSDCYLPRTGGMETQVRSLALQQALAGHEVRIITATPGHDAVRSGRDEVDGLRVDRVAARMPFELPVHPRTRHHVSQLLRDQPIDVVHVHAGVVSPFAWGGVRAALAVGVPVLVTVHSVWDSWQGSLFAAANGRAGWTRRGVRLSAVSDLAASHVSGSLGVAVDVIPNGIDPGQWEVKEWMPGVGALRVVTVMRMAPRKRTQPLVRILASALEQLDGNLEAQLVGDGPERAGSERLARQLGVADKIHFAGRLDRSQILDVFAQSDVYIQPSVKESFGIAALEARTAGLPVVARIQSGTTQFIHDGVEGRLATDDQAMASVLVELGRDPAALAKLTEHNRAVEPHEAWPVVLDAVASAYASAQRSCV